MAKNKIQFQAGYSLFELIQDYGTNAIKRYINGVGQQVLFVLNVVVRNTVFLELDDYIHAINVTIKRQ
jgi:hypothetical protein